MAPQYLRSLYLKLVLPIAGLVLASTVVVSFFAMRAMREGVRLVAGQRAQFALAYTRNLLEDFEHEMRADHGIRLQGVIERMGANPDLEVVRILSRSGEVLYSSKPQERGRLLPVHAPHDGSEPPNAAGVRVVEMPGVLHAIGPVVNRRRCAACHKGAPSILAYVDVDISLSRQAAGMRTWGTMATVAGILQFAAIGLGILAIVVVVVLRPIGRLTRSMDLVQHGQLDVAADPAGTAELDTLVAGFNSMVSRLRTARAAEQEGQRAQLARVEQLATIGEMAASLAHEIRNPLSGIKAAIDILAGEEKAEEARTILAHVSAELGRVDRVIRQLLNYARPKAPVMVHTDLKDLVAETVALAGSSAAAQGVRLTLTAERPVMIVADSEMIHQVIVNLLLNALHALEGAAEPRVDVSVAVHDGRATCRVCDNGPGVPADRAEAIFRPFVTTKTRGTGLGLATSRRMIELHGGQLDLANPGQAGACFVFRLPLSDGPGAVQRDS